MAQTDSAPPPQLELAAAEEASAVLRPPKSLWRETLERLLRKPSAIVGLVILGFLVLVAIFAPVIATHDPLDVLLDIPEEGAQKRMDPCIHALGCPDVGDEVLSVTADAPVAAAALNSKNSQVFAANGNLITVWNAESGKELMRFEHDDPVTAAIWSPTDQLIVSSAGDFLYIWDVNRRDLKDRLPNEAGPADFLAWKSGGFLAARADSVNTWALVGTEELPGQAAGTAEGDAEAPVDEVPADEVPADEVPADEVPADETVIEGEEGAVEGEVASRISETRLDWTHMRLIEVPEGLIAADWDTHGKKAMIVTTDAVQIWTVQDLSNVTTYGFGNTDSAPTVGIRESKVDGGPAIPHEQPITAAKLNKERTRILTVSGDKLYMWEASLPYTQINVIEPPDAYDAPLVNGGWVEAISRGVRYVMASSGDTGFVWDSRTGELLHTLPHGEPILQMSSSPLATMIFTRSQNYIRVWKVEDGSQWVTIQPDEPITGAVWQQAGGGILVHTGNKLSMVKTSPYEYIMGVDGNVRDQFSRVIYGTRVSLMVGVTTVSFAVILGVIAGAVAGFLGGWVDNIIMRIMDVMLAFPALILAIAVVTVLGPGLTNALLAISVTFIPQYARVARSGVLAVKEEDFVTADRALGVRPVRILFRRVLPNALAPLIVQATLGIGTAILDAAALSFLGLGAQPPTPEWGAMLGAERNQILTAPHLVFFPGIAIMITVLAFNLLGDGLRDALDPRLDR